MNSILCAQKRMEEFTHEFPDDIVNSISIAKENPIRLKKDEIDNIIICGMGGSGIGGMIANDILQNHITMPIEFIKGYDLPEYASKNTLVICSSYSGNTEETLTLFNQALKSNSKIIVICSGGELQNLANKQSIQTLLIPGGKQPRAAVGYSIVQQLHILSTLFLNIVEKESLLKNLSIISQELKISTSKLEEKAKMFAKKLEHKNIFLYTENQFASIGLRFTQQINENVKKKAHLGIIPEMNHNELVAFTDFTNKDVAIIINDDLFHPQNKKRTNFMKQELKNQKTLVLDINQKGNSTEGVFLKTIYFLDLVSIELAKIKGIDPEEIYVINRMKDSI